MAEKDFTVDKRESAAKESESRAGRESSRLDMPSRVNISHERRGGRGREDGQEKGPGAKSRGPRT